ncbi:hypothetical protein CBM2604_B80002 [Cupriavidus taiwanensis]|nr:hypothetical protein CBM2604_B80002 [Cupriavidus taiwanensis]
MAPLTIRYAPSMKPATAPNRDATIILGMTLSLATPRKMEIAPAISKPAPTDDNTAVAMPTPASAFPHPSCALPRSVKALLNALI